MPAKPCPAVLKEFLAIINLIPLDERLPALSSTDAFKNLQQTRSHRNVTAYELIDRFYALCQVLSNVNAEGLSRYVLGPGFEVWISGIASKRRRTKRGRDVVAAIQRYDEVRHARILLKGIMNLSASRRRGRPSRRVEGLLMSVTAYVDENDSLHLQPASFIRTLVRDDVEISYIRRCANKSCGRVFYAGRHDQQGCTTRCANARRVQKSRDPAERLKAKIRRYDNEVKKSQQKLSTRRQETATPVKNRRRSKKHGDL